MATIPIVQRRTWTSVVASAEHSKDRATRAMAVPAPTTARTPDERMASSVASAAGLPSGWDRCSSLCARARVPRAKATAMTAAATTSAGWA